MEREERKFEKNMIGFFQTIHSKKGKQIFPRNGMIIPEGSIVLDNRGNFHILKENHVYVKRREYNSLCQSYEETVELKKVEKKI